MNRLFRLGPVLRARKAQEDAARAPSSSPAPRSATPRRWSSGGSSTWPARTRRPRAPRGPWSPRWWPGSRWRPACPARTGWSPTPRSRARERQRRAGRRREAPPGGGDDGRAARRDGTRPRPRRSTRRNIDELAVTSQGAQRGPGHRRRQRGAGQRAAAPATAPPPTGRPRPATPPTGRRQRHRHRPGRRLAGERRHPGRPGSSPLSERRRRIDRATPTRTGAAHDGCQGVMSRIAELQTQLGIAPAPTPERHLRHRARATPPAPRAHADRR